MLIREARVDDSPGLARVQVESYRTAYADLLPDDYLAQFTYEEQEQDWRDLLAERPETLLLIAETPTGEIAGYALGGREEAGSASHSGPEERRGSGGTGDPVYGGELVALHVRREHQGQGIGRMLVATVAHRLRQEGCVYLMLWVLAGNDRARRFYEGLGGRLIGERRLDLGGGDISPVEVAYGWDDIGVLC